MPPKKVWKGAAGLRKHLVDVATVEPHPSNPRRGLSEQERGYLAGILDGEGCIGVHRRIGPRYGAEGGSASVAVNNTDERLILWLSERFGGHVMFTPATNPKWSDLYSWKVRGKHAEIVLREALPALVSKREQALLALQFIQTQTNPGRRGHSEETLALRREIFAMCAYLNRKGRRAA